MTIATHFAVMYEPDVLLVLFWLVYSMKFSFNLSLLKAVKGNFLCMRFYHLTCLVLCNYLSDTCIHECLPFQPNPPQPKLLMTDVCKEILSHPQRCQKKKKNIFQKTTLVSIPKCLVQKLWCSYATNGRGAGGILVGVNEPTKQCLEAWGHCWWCSANQSEDQSTDPRM